MLKVAKDFVKKKPVHQALVESPSKQLQSALHECDGAAVLKRRFTRLGHGTYVAEQERLRKLLQVQAALKDREPCLLHCFRESTQHSVRNPGGARRTIVGRLEYT